MGIKPIVHKKRNTHPFYEAYLLRRNILLRVATNESRLESAFTPMARDGGVGFVQGLLVLSVSAGHSLASLDFQKTLREMKRFCTNHRVQKTRKENGSSPKVFT